MYRFVKPITRGQYFDSSPAEIHMMKLRSAILNRLLDVCIDRKDSTTLMKMLPKKHEYILYIPLTGIQVQLYEVTYLPFVCYMIDTMEPTIS